MAQFTNQAQLRYGNSIANSNIAVGELLEVLSASKTAVRKTYGQNDTVTYIITVVNSGTTAFNGLTVTDNLGAYTFGTETLTPLTYMADSVKYYVNGVLQSTPVVVAEPSLAISGLTVPAGGNITVAYETEVNAFAPMEVTLLEINAVFIEVPLNASIPIFSSEAGSSATSLEQPLNA